MKALAVAAGIVFWTLVLGIAWLAFFPGSDSGEPVAILQIEPAALPSEPAETPEAPPLPEASGTQPATPQATTDGADLPPGFAVPPGPPQAPIMEPPGPGQAAPVVPMGPGGQLDAPPSAPDDAAPPEGADQQGAAPAETGMQQAAVEPAVAPPPPPPPPIPESETGSIPLPPVPVADVFARALQVGVVQPGAQVEGFAYFPRLRPGVRTLTLEFHHRVGGQPRVLAIPFAVRVPAS